MAKVRIATVQATGDRYLVSRLYLPTVTTEPAKAFCWGEVESTKGRSTKHGERKVFLLDAVEVDEVVKDEELVHQLWMQGIRKLRAAGHDIEVHRTRAGNWRATDRGRRVAQ